MIGIIILTLGETGKHLVSDAEHITGGPVEQIESITAGHGCSPDILKSLISEKIKSVDSGEGVLILTDVVGATHTNVACQLLKQKSVELVTGISLPMLVRVLNYRQLPLNDLVDMATSGGRDYVIRPSCPVDALKKTDEM